MLKIVVTAQLLYMVGFVVGVNVARAEPTTIAKISHRMPSQQATGKERPPLRDASHAANHRAKYDCVNRIFPYDPKEFRCRSAGVYTEAGDKGFNQNYNNSAYVRHDKTTWYLRGWATNQFNTTLAFTVRVRYVPSGPSKGLVSTWILRSSECYWQVHGKDNPDCKLTF